jgi:NADPH-dependent 2,4-dienoyl-CoA reductase/sulfur reductase-like enzyme
MLLVPPVCLPVPNCCKKSAWFANRRGFGSSGKYGLCTLRSAGCRACVSAAVAASAGEAGEMDAIRKPVVDKAVIVGGGLGGLAAAIQLRKVGIDAQVWPLFLSSSFDPWPPRVSLL